MKIIIELNSEDSAKFNWFDKLMLRFYKSRLDFYVGIGYWKAYNELDSLRKYH